jgi:GMP synthase-like glutamine amidotransferase
MPRLAIVNLNMEASETRGCLRIAAALQHLAGCGPDGVEVVHQATLRSDPGLMPRLLASVDAVVLGPQGTPFSAYDAGFLPWLRQLVQACQLPILGVCGGMQALALAFGGALETAYGGVLTDNTYSGQRKVVGPLPIQFHHDHLPQWLPADARQHLANWPSTGWSAWQSHVEQVRVLPAEFVCVASSEPTAIEAIAHRSRPILASQFHPELGWEPHQVSPWPVELAGQSATPCLGGEAWLRAFLALV